MLALAAVAALAFAAIEVAEGRGLLGSALVPGLALVPLAGIVSWIARRVETFAGHTGTRVAAYLRRAPKRFSVLVMGMRAFGELWPAQIRGRRATRGRAPPRFA